MHTRRSDLCKERGSELRSETIAITHGAISAPVHRSAADHARPMNWIVRSSWALAGSFVAGALASSSICILFIG